jgi:hypothetical protein
MSVFRDNSFVADEGGGAGAETWRADAQVQACLTANGQPLPAEKRDLPWAAEMDDRGMFRVVGELKEAPGIGEHELLNPSADALPFVTGDFNVQTD